MRVIGVIPSRWGSTRFPGKSLYPICGKPLVQWVVEAVQRAKTLDEVLVATDDKRIADAVSGFAKVVMTRPDHPSGTDRVAEAACPADDDIVINIQGDEPLIDPGLVDALATRMENDPGWAMATAACPIRTMRDLEARTVVKVVLAQDGGALYFSRLPIPCRRDGEPDLAAGLYLRHLGIYAYRGAFLKRLVREPPCTLEKTESLEQLRALYLGGRIAVIRTEDQGVGVDTPADVAAVEEILRARN
ncbi:MAG TPA: 3-deoxy-manno-octulosonate cytidylyltransferase [Kiritimatiellia bacterium]|nr:3-deoxy-manno-octulosonate cytidylyltransferase [Kiritimatiellia bacterium]HPS09060.1 3-deoxy-manno-octulosonate cytidylyltransferase [Kiritimatiellia bacterium]